MTFKYIRDFRQHLNEKHQIQFDVEDKKFNTYSDFLNWKVNYESETCSCFYHRKNLTRNGRRVEYWYCNRSGIYQSVLQNRKRKLKSQGILKINNNCTSSITLTINEIDDTVQAIIYHTHYGHEAELVHLRIPKSDKQEIASKLLQGVNVEDILSSYKEDGLSKQIERKHLIKRRDVLNISKKHNVNIKCPKLQPSTNKIKRKLNQETIEPPIINSSLSMIEAKKRHFIASQLALSFVNPVHENIWRITMGNVSVSTFSSNNNQEVYVSKNDVALCSSDYCKSYCHYCNICYHTYSCTCSDFTLKKIICEHIHLTVIFQAKSETCQYEENIERRLYGNQDHTKYTQNYTESPCLKLVEIQYQDHSKYTQNCAKTNNSHQPIKNGNQDHTKYTQKCAEPSYSQSQKSIKDVKLCYPLENNDIYKPNMKTKNLKSVKTRLKKLMMSISQKIDECNNSDLLENLEKQITNISCNLGKDLLENASKKRNEVQTMIAERKIEVYYVV